MKLLKDQIEKLEHEFKINLINSISGIKPANLIGTKSLMGTDNIAIFSSVVHLGSNPALLGFVMRPQIDSPKDTYSNIKETGYYTINHISESFIKKAHYTSAKLSNTQSEFDMMKLKREYIDDFYAPFLKESKVKIGMKHLKSIPLPNGCIFTIGSIELITYPDNIVNGIGQLNLEQYEGVGISGLNTYYSLNKLETFPFVRMNNIPNFE